MKQFIFLSLLFISGLTFAQTNPATNMVATQDTVINGGTTSHVKLLVAHYPTVTVAVRITKVSGTVGGSAALQGSIDGTNYFAISGASNLTLTDVASQGTLWVTTNAPYSYYRVLTTGTGTMRAIVSAKILPKK